ncbi:reverse transcriptase domain-containing protein [Tanacetum coccineum]|uniref:Reverse transcriptase domain-containing protein n=1 Tax=Tanacetum coccineum TaxID=301880 RepID=A0ABQ5HMA3_9ASTR
MRTRSQARRRRQPQVRQTSVESPNLEKPNPPIVTMDDNRTMAQLLEAPTEGYEDAIVVPEITANNFEIKHARIWLDKEPPRSILTWDDLVSKFINKFFPPSKTTNLRNEITRFQQRFDESFYEAWDRFNDLLRACPHHGFLELHQLDTFYNALNTNDQDFVVLSARVVSTTRSGGCISRIPRFLLFIFASESTNDESCTEVTKDTTAHTNIEAPKTSNLLLFKSNLKIQLPSLMLIPLVLQGLTNKHRFRFLQEEMMKGAVKKLTTKLRNSTKSLEIEFRNLALQDALTLMPKFALTLKTLIGNKEKLSEMARTPLNENCSVVILNKLPKKLGDPGRFLIPCEFSGINTCNQPSGRSGASINLMPISSCSINELIGIAKDVRLMVGKFQFPADFVIVYEVKLTLRVGKEDHPFNLDQTSRYTANYNHMTANRIDVIELASEEYSQEVLGFSDSVAYGPHKRAIAWKLSDIKGVDPEFCTHKILMEEDYEPTVQSQRRVNPKIHDVIKKEVEKLLDAGLIYPISDSPWVSPVHCVPKKGGITVIKNDDNDLIPTRLVTGWRVCIDYRKLNEATRKDHFPLPFMDQMLKRLAGNQYYCFLDGFSGYFQIPIDPKDQEKTTFTCPYGTFAYRRMPFGLCNAPGTFQRCMMAIFHDMIEKTMEVFMDDFSVFGDSFSTCLSHLEKMLKRCEDTNLALNWEKSHFMVKEGIVLGHKISKSGIEVDRAKVEVIAKLPHPTTVKGVRSFLGHAGFYRRFIQDFSKIARPMTHLLEKETPFFFSKECIESFNTLKRKLSEALILIAPDWDLPFELMCDASDFAIGAVLGQ